jgi:hypothetical protein
MNEFGWLQPLHVQEEPNKNGLQEDTSCFCFVVVAVVDNRVRCIEVSARATAKVRHAGCRSRP